MPDGDRPSADLPVAEPTEVEARASRSRARRPFAIAVVAVIVVAALAIPIALRSSSSAPEHRNARRATKHVDSHQARLAVGAALAATIAAPSYHASSVMDLTNPPGVPQSRQSRGLRIAAEATINRDPTAMYAVADVSGLGQIHSWTDGTRQWEQGGGNYGMTSGGAGPGQSISSFAGLVLGSLGPREGNVAMMSLASPSGYFDIADQAVTGVTATGTTTSDGVQLTEYDVTLDAAQLLNTPGMTVEQRKTAKVALAGLQDEGYGRTAIHLGVDDAGYVRIAHTAWNFADGGAVTTDSTYSEFGCAGTVTLPGAAPAPPPTPTCTSSETTPNTANTLPTTTDTGAPPATIPGPKSSSPTTPATVAESPGTSASSAQPDTQIAYAFGHFFDPALSADGRASLIQGSAAMRAFIDASFTRHAAEAAAGEIDVDSITVSGDTAAVTFHALYGGGESPANPGEIHGTAVFEDGTWKISRATFCSLSANDGEVCPPA